MFKSYQKLVFFDFETTGLDMNSDPQIGDFPIELALLVTDHKLNIIGKSFVSLINWDIITDSYNNKNWGNLPATKVHNIKLDDILELGIRHNVNNRHDKHDILIPHLIETYLNNLPLNEDDQLILVSDNPYFDFTLLKKMYNVKTENPCQFPFHYNCYSPLMLFKAINMENNNKHKKVHRALDDVYDLYKSCVIAFDRLGIFEEEKVDKDGI